MSQTLTDLSQETVASQRSSWLKHDLLMMLMWPLETQYGLNRD